MTEKPKKRVSVVLPPALENRPSLDIHPAYGKLRDEEFRKAEEREEETLADIIERWQAQIEELKAMHKRVEEAMKGLR